jgi:hypothetical protein
MTTSATAPIATTITSVFLNALSTSSLLDCCGCAGNTSEATTTGVEGTGGSDGGEGGGDAGGHMGGGEGDEGGGQGFEGGCEGSDG